MTGVRVSRRTVLLRGLRARCPACGAGGVFVRAFTTSEACAGCGFAFERGPGHWVGGNEINLLVTYPTSVAALAVPAFLWGASWVTAAAGGLLATAIGLLVHRPARGLFFAIDYLVEPAWTSDDGGRGGDGRERPGAPAPPPRGPGGRGARGVIELPVATPAPREDAEPARAPLPLLPAAAE